jgi:hypothetical protein
MRKEEAKILIIQQKFTQKFFKNDKLIDVI